MCLASKFTRFVAHNAGLYIPWDTKLTPLFALFLGAAAEEAEHASCTFHIKLKVVGVPGFCQGFTRSCPVRLPLVSDRPHYKDNAGRDILDVMELHHEPMEGLN